MNNLATASLVVLLGSATLMAQSPTQNPVRDSVPNPTSAPTHDPNLLSLSVVLPESQSCPVQMSAKQRAGGDVMNAREARQGETIQRIRMTLGNTTSPAEITKIKISVHGTSSKNRAIRTVLAQEEISDTSKTFDLRLNIGEKEEISTNLSLHGFTSVQSISLESVNYADGSTWSASANRRCDIAPDPLMLVD